ncbi:peptidylprolyl isomerase [Bradyrhizobium sp. INPA01-394B]|uniref:Parvulin-like PPIase n=1 Tax=Bradyrhizobium campsiandrae TaxID=1729892 RepID=A0ABR7UAU4_9BRAD|nr:peptidylprolyl isomerase [Bradyrhizobium campsiandrae]MBC9879650.1 peptidylprolyl isomerase [Bradyrhizobium campsiandrae]MBC9980745.1 peptidylprolyl isomerase [Bradyrhizobium campsiandrae]
MNKTAFHSAILAVTMGAAIATAAQAQTRPAGQQPAGRAAPAAAPAPAPTPPRPAAEDGPAIKNTEVVARVGDGDITAEEIRAAIGQLDARQQAAVARDPALLSQTVRAILATRLVLKEAIGKKWDQQPAVAAQLVRVRDNLIAETYLQSVTTPPDSFPSEAEIKSVYEANASALLVPRRFKLAQIVVNLAKDADKGAEDAARRKLDEIVRKVKATGQDFGSLARSASEDTASAERDGEIGWINEPDLRPEIRSQVIGLQKSGVTEPVRLDDGWHVLKLLDTEAARTRALAEVRDALVQRIRAERAETNRRAYMAELLKQTPPVVNELALSKLFDNKPEPVPSR